MQYLKGIMVPNPDDEARYSLIRLLMTKHRHNMSESHFRSLAKKTNLYSCSDLSMLCNDAAMGPLRSMRGSVLLRAKKSDIPKIDITHFESSLKNVRASCAESAIQHYFKWDEQFGSKLFLTMDVLPGNMKQKPLLSVEEEKRKKNEAEDAKKREEMKENEAKQKEEEQQKRHSKKLLSINTTDNIKPRRKSDLVFSKKRKSNKSKTTPTTPSGDGSISLKKRKSGSLIFGKKDKSNKMERASSHQSYNSSGSLPDSSFADTKKLWNKRSSKSGSDKKKRSKK